MQAYRNLNITKRMRPQLGTFVEISIPHTNDHTPEEINQAIHSAFAEIERIQASMSFHQPDSELNHLNAQPYNWHPVSADLNDLLRKGADLQLKTDGAFTLFSGETLQTLGILPTHHKRLIADRAITSKTLPCIEFQDSPQPDLTTFFVKVNTSLPICLDGIAKGYAVDKAVQALRGHGIQNGMVNAGGDLSIFGDFATSTQQRNANGFSRLPEISNCALATSQQQAVPDKHYPAWIIRSDGQKVLPATASVIAQHCYLADALTKAFLVTPVSEHKRLEQRFNVSVFYHSSNMMSPVV